MTDIDNITFKLRKRKHGEPNPLVGFVWYNIDGDIVTTTLDGRIYNITKKRIEEDKK